MGNLGVKNFDFEQEPQTEAFTTEWRDRKENLRHWRQKEEMDTLVDEDDNLKMIHKIWDTMERPILVMIRRN